MNISKENTLRIIGEVNSRRIDIEKNIRRAAEFQGEKGVAIFTKYISPEDYNEFATKKL